MTTTLASDVSMPTETPQIKVGVLLLNLGGPTVAEDVEGFLYNLFADPDIIRLPPLVSFLQKPLASIISARRAPKSKAAYEAIGGGSPIVKYTRAQADGISKRLQQRGFKDAKAYVAMRYWHPFTDQALEEMDHDGVNALVVLPLYPQFSISTSGSSLRVLREALLKDVKKWAPEKIRHTVVPAWYNRRGYVKAVGDLIRGELAQYTKEERDNEGIHVLFSAHGVPKSYIDAGDPYQRHVQECVALIEEEYAGPGVTTHLSYQSRVGPIEWLRPYTEDRIPELGQSGVKNLVVVPISFVSEHIETLEEIDIEYRELAEGNGIIKWRRVPALNTDTAFLDELADLCIDALADPAISISESCSLHNVDLEGDPVLKALATAKTRNQVLSALTFASVWLDVLFGKGIALLFGAQ
ncbi:unnamed protein product [Choristocarpus tenellus]